MQGSHVIYAKQSSIPGRVLTISREVFTAMNPYSQAAALALEKIGKVRIMDEEDQELSSDCFDS